MEVVSGFAAFDRETVSLANAVGMVEGVGLGFEPGHARYGDVGAKTQDGKFSWDQARRVTRSFSTDGGPRLDDGDAACSLRVADRPTMRQITLSWTMPEEWVEQLVAKLDHLSAEAGFTYAVITDPETFWQSNDDPDPYEYLGRSLDGVRFLPDGRIDISGNPGREDIMLGLRFVAGVRLWFGRSMCDGLFERDRILAAPGTVTERADGVIEVDLYDLDEPLETIRGRQQAFRDVVGMDAVVKRAEQVQASLVPDQDIDVDTEGPFSHGGTYRTTVWHDVKGERTHRTAAATSTVTEFNDDGQVMHQETAQVN